jgi:tetratricopeptide (TPR) repeat protein
MLLLSACVGRNEGGTDAAKPAPGSPSAADNFPDPVLRQLARSRWVGPFSPAPGQPSAAAVAEAREVDAIRQLMDDGLYDQVRQRLKALLDGGCRHPEAFLLQARLLYLQSAFADAAPWCDQAIAASPYWIEPRVLLAQCYIRLKRLGAAENVFADIDRLGPKSPWGPFGMGAVAAMRGHHDRAVALLDEALRRDLRHAPSLRGRMELAAQDRQTELEERLLARYLAEEPTSAWAQARQGDLAVAAGRLEDARRAYLRSYELVPQPTIARRLAELAQQRGDEVDASRWQGKAGVAPRRDRGQQNGDSEP